MLISTWCRCSYAAANILTNVVSTDTSPRTLHPSVTPSQRFSASLSTHLIIIIALSLTFSGNVMKPTLDMFIFTAQLSRSLGFRGTVLLFANYYATVSILRAVTPAFGKLAAVEAMLEGEYRAGMGRVGRESEEVA